MVAATITYALVDKSNQPTPENSSFNSTKLFASPGGTNRPMDSASGRHGIYPATTDPTALNKKISDPARGGKITLASFFYATERDEKQSQRGGPKLPSGSLQYLLTLRSSPAQRPSFESLRPSSETAGVSAESTRQWEAEEIEIGSGDSLAKIMAKAGYSPKVVHNLMNSGKPANHLTNLHPGQKLTIFRDKQGEFAGLHYHVGTKQTLKIERTGVENSAPELHASLEPRQVKRQRIRTVEPLSGSLYLTARRAGLSDQMIMNLAGILSWEIDLGRQPRKNDQLTVIYDKIKTPAGKVLETEIQAVKYEGKYANFEAIKFATSSDKSSYYTLEGENLRRELKRYPVEYTRISSHFDLNRRHPVLGVRRPHLGVDLAAPIGTPIYAAGDGRVTERGRNGGYGRLVSIEHGSGYRTLYAHLNDFARGVDVGDRVEQGQIIGYVGQSGTTTGPHLHYEVIVNGRHRNPVEVALPQADPLTGEYLAEFRSHAEPLVQALREPGSDDGKIRLAASD